MFCEQCGTKNIDGANFCQSCGAAVAPTSTDAKSAEPSIKNSQSYKGRKVLEWSDGTVTVEGEDQRFATVYGARQHIDGNQVSVATAPPKWHADTSESETSAEGFFTRNRSLGSVGAVLVVLLVLGIRHFKDDKEPAQATRSTPAQTQTSQPHPVAPPSKSVPSQPPVQNRTADARIPALRDERPKQASAQTKTEVTINGMDLSYALYAGSDHNGKTKESYFLEMEGNRVRLVSSFVYGKDTSRSSPWFLLIGDNTPRILCEQSSKEARKLVANLTKKLSTATVIGDFKEVSGNMVYLSECIIEQ